jgi:hypothetical protein
MRFECQEPLYVRFTENGSNSIIPEYMLDSVGAQKVRWDKGGTEPSESITLSYGNWNENNHLGAGFLFLVHKGITSVVKTVKCIYYTEDFMHSSVCLSFVHVYINAQNDLINDGKLNCSGR